MLGVHILKEMDLLSFTHYILYFVLHGHFVNCFRVHFFAQCYLHSPGLSLHTFSLVGIFF